MHIYLNPLNKDPKSPWSRTLRGRATRIPVRMGTSTVYGLGFVLCIGVYLTVKDTINAASGDVSHVMMQDILATIVACVGLYVLMGIWALLLILFHWS